MDSKTAGLGIVLVLALHSAFAQEAVDANLPPPPPEPTAEQRDAGRQYQQAQLDLYDALRGDSSPRTQVLAARIYFDEDDAANALRPKRADVVARAAQLAPDDAFVQWIAAAEGNYYSSQCGPTQWPEAEVGNLVRLEPDNAGALLYAVALAQAKGDAGMLDEALARMASATRANGHAGEEIAAWRQLHATQPAARKTGMFAVDDDAIPAPLAALRYALQRSGLRYSSADSALKAACKPGAESDHAWQRLGWCTDAGRLLAGRGDSFALRELGLAMLDAIGSGDIADLRRQFDWLQANAASPNTNPSAFMDEADAALADWRNAPDEITATERRLKRLGKPATPPDGWVARSTEPEANTAAAWQSYLRGVVDDLRGSSDVRERAVGLSVDTSAFTAEESDGEAKPESADSGAGLAELAAAHPDDRFVQWNASIAGKAGEAKNADATAHVRQLESDNAAAWTLALQPGQDSTEVLHHAAAATYFDEHVAEPILLLHAVFKRHPMPEELQQQWDTGEFTQARDPANVRAFAAATALAAANLSVDPSANVLKTCPDIAKADAVAKADCVTVARLMLNSHSSLIAVMIGESTLRKLDALDSADLARARQVAWWQSQSIAIGRDLERYIDDYAASGNEIDALQRLLARAGKDEPPAGWQSPAEKRAAKGQ